MPLRRTEGIEKLLEAGSEALFLVDEQAQPGQQATAAADRAIQVAELEAVLPDESDLDGLSELLIDGFARILQARLLSREKWGLLADVWNWIMIRIERKVVRAALGQNLQMVTLRPSVCRPRGRQFEGHGLGLMLVPRGNAAEPVAFCELCVMIPDGRRPDDTAEIMQMIVQEPVGSDAEPYLLNFCVAEKYRRCGVGRALLRLAEDIVIKVWGGERLWLHAGADEAAAGLYASAGYAVVNGSESSEVGSELRDSDVEPIHMVKDLVRTRQLAGA